MAVTYKLQIHSRDVLNIGNHTGYDLVKYVNGKPTEIRSLDLTWSGLLDITINDSGWKTAVTTDTDNGQVWGTEIFIDGEYVDYTPEMVEDERFHTATLINDSEQAQEVFSWMLLDAQFRNELKNVDGGLLTYDALELNCNVWTNTMAQNYLSGQNVFGALGNLTFQGSNDTMTTGAEGTDLANCQQIASFLSKFKSEISSKDYDISSAKVKLEDSSEGWHCIISDCNIDGEKKTYIYDTSGDCSIRATKDQDTIARLDGGKNYIYLGNGNNEVYGGSDYDSITVGNGNDKVYAGNGENIVNLEGGIDYYEGGKDIDKVTARNGESTIYTYAGDDDVNTLVGAHATDINHIYLGAGEDTFTGGVGIDIVDGGVSEDVETDTNTIHLGGGNDGYSGGIGKDKVDGGSGDNTIRTGAGNDEVKMSGSTSSDLNWVYLGKGSDSFDGGAGRDVVNGGQKEDVTEDKNTINLNGGSDEYKGGAGTDIVHGGNDSDTIYGGDGHNELHGDAGNDYLAGGEGNNELYGGTGHDILIGGKERDTMKGGTGADSFEGRGGINYIYCGKDNAIDTVCCPNFAA